METNITYQKSYREYKAELDGVLQRTAESFVPLRATDFCAFPVILPSDLQNPDISQ